MPAILPGPSSLDLSKALLPQTPRREPAPSIEVLLALGEGVIGSCGTYRTYPPDKNA